MKLESATQSLCDGRERRSVGTPRPTFTGGRGPMADRGYPLFVLVVVLIKRCGAFGSEPTPRIAGTSTTLDQSTFTVLRPDGPGLDTFVQDRFLAAGGR